MMGGMSRLKTREVVGTRFTGSAGSPGCKKKVKTSFGRSSSKGLGERGAGN